MRVTLAASFITLTIAVAAGCGSSNNAKVDAAVAPPDEGTAGSGGAGGFFSGGSGGAGGTGGVAGADAGQPGDAALADGSAPDGAIADTGSVDGVDGATGVDGPIGVDGESPDLPPPADTSLTLDANIGDGPGAGRSALLVTAVAAEPTDQALLDRMAAAGLHVIQRDETQAVAGSDVGMALLVFGSTTSGAAATLGTSFSGVAVPAIVIEPTLMGTMQLTGTATADRGTETGQNQVNLLPNLNMDPNITALQAGEGSGAEVVYNLKTSLNWGMPGAGALKIGTVVGKTSEVAFFAYPPVAAMVGRNAPAKRIAFFMHDNKSMPVLNDVGVKLLDAAIAWSVQ